MSAYDKLGLAMIPSGYKGEADENNAGGFLGKVYSVLPAQTTSDNLVTNGDFSDGSTGWTLGSWILQNGEATIDGSQTSVAPLTKYNLPIYNSDTLKLTFDVTRSAGTISYMYLAGTFISAGINESGTYTYTVNYTNSQTLQIVADADFIGSVDNIKVVRITDGDFDFSRGSDATRVNSQGYIESVQVLSDELVQNGDFEEIGDELVTNGGFDTDSDWTTTSSVTIENGKANFDNTPAYEFALRQLPISGVTIGKIYKVSFDLTVESGNIAVYLTDPPSNSDSLTESGTYTYYFKATNTQLRFRAIDLGFTGSIDNVSVKEVGQNWTFGTGWSIEDDGGNLRASQDNSTPSTGDLVYSNVFTIGKKYRINFDVVRNSGTISVIADGHNTYTESGSYSIDKEPTSTNLTIRNFSSFTGTIDNISVVEITDDTDIPRLDYSDGCPTLLLEPQRINTAFENGDFVTSSSASTTYNYGISPSGKKDSIKLESTSTGASYIRTSPLTTIGTQACSVFVKKGVGDYAQLIQAGSGNHFANFDLTSGTVTSEGSTTSASVEDYGDWLRLIAVFDNVTSSAGSFRLYLSDSATAGFGGAPSAVGNYLEFWGFQVEIGDYVTSYIENTTPNTTVTRLADVCNNAGDSTIFNDNEGVLYFEAKVLDVSTGGGSRVISISDGSDSNTVRIDLNNNQFRFQVIDGGSFTVSNNVNGNDDLSYNKIAARYKENDCAFYVNGVNIAADTSATMPSGLSVLNFARAQQNSGRFYGNVRSLLYFNEALTDAQLEKLTSSTATQVLNNYSTLLTRVGATYESSGLETKLNELL